MLIYNILMAIVNDESQDVRIRSILCSICGFIVENDLDTLHEYMIKISELKVKQLEERRSK